MTQQIVVLHACCFLVAAVCTRELAGKDGREHTGLRAAPTGLMMDGRTADCTANRSGGGASVRVPGPLNGLAGTDERPLSASALQELWESGAECLIQTTAAL